MSDTRLRRVLAKNRIELAIAVSVVAVSILAAASARADRRHLAWTYEAQTLKRGEAELETYTTFSASDLQHTKGQTSTQLQYELEIGMTDRFDFGLYQVFEQDPGTGLAYAGYKLRFRHWLVGAGGFPLDAVGYLEYKGTPDFSGHAIETKLLLGRDFGRFRVALNPILEFEREHGEHGEEWETKAEYALGLAWTPAELISFGLEANGSKDAHYLAPVIGHGVGDLWLAFGPSFRIADSSDKEGDAEGGPSAASAPESQIRILIGFNVRGS